MPVTYLGLVRIRGKVQIGEQQVVRAQHLQLHGLRFLDLDDHFSRLEDRRGIGQDFRSRCDGCIASAFKTDPGWQARLHRVFSDGGQNRSANC